MAEEGRKNENEPSGRPNPEGEVSLPALLEASKSLETRLDSDSDAPKTGSSSSKKRQHFDSDSEAPKTETSKKRTWSLEEVTAVEKTLMAFINSGGYAAPGVNHTVIRERQWQDGGDVALGMLAGAATGLAIGSLFVVF